MPNDNWLSSVLLLISRTPPDPTLCVPKQRTSRNKVMIQKHKTPSKLSLLKYVKILIMFDFSSVYIYKYNYTDDKPNIII